MLLKRFLLTAALLAGYVVSAEAVFEENFNIGLDAWRSYGKQPVIRLVDVSGGGRAVEFDLNSKLTGKNRGKWLNAFESKLFPVSKGTFRLTGKIQFPKNFGVAIHVRFYDGNKKRVGDMNTYFGSKPVSPSRWLDIDVTGAAYRDDVAFASVGVVFQPWTDVVVRIDDLKLEYRKPGPEPPLWAPSYKLDPVADCARLTPADFPGPDGIVYPNFSRAGVQKRYLVARPSRRAVVTPASGDFCGAVMKAVARFGSEGGVIEIAPGEYRLSRFLFITRDNVVLKGAGKGKTRIYFDYKVPESGIDFYGIGPDTVLGPESNILVIVRPGKIEQIRLFVNGREIRRAVRGMYSGNDSFLVGSMRNFKGKPGNGRLKLRVDVSYTGTPALSREIAVRYDPAYRWNAPPRPAGAIVIQGGGPAGKQFALAETAPRGSMCVRLKRADHGLKAGDAVLVEAPATAAWKKLTHNACTWGVWRNYLVFIRKVNGAVLELDQPLRLDFPLDSRPFVQKVRLIQGCGVEDLYLEHKTGYWVNGIDFRYAANCHASGVKVVMAGRSPIYGRNMKFCSILDCEVDDGWFKGGGGTAYVGFEASYDNLMDRMVSRNMRHAPCVQWAAAGNVIRNSVFHGSDAQWHSGWTNENLFENCEVISDTMANGGYGYGAWASPPEDGSHGPNGPRNVVYNCDIVSEKTAVWLGGMNENWIFVGNRLHSRHGTGFFAKDNSFDHILCRNVFILENPEDPAVILGSVDCGGLEFCDNLIYGGNSRSVGGLRQARKESGNRFLPLVRNAARPALKVPSIYEWQKNSRKPTVTSPLPSLVPSSRNR